MDNNLIARQVILDHYKNPFNKVNEKIDGYEAKLALNPSCGDEVEVYVLFEGDKVVDIKFNGSGCSICCASASVMTQELNGLSKDEVVEKINDYYDLIHEGTTPNIDKFEDAQVFSSISDFPARFKCAFLAWDTLKKIILEENNE